MLLDDAAGCTPPRHEGARAARRGSSVSALTRGAAVAAEGRTARRACVAKPPQESWRPPRAGLPSAAPSAQVDPGQQQRPDELVLTGVVGAGPQEAWAEVASDRRGRAVPAAEALIRQQPLRGEAGGFSLLAVGLRRQAAALRRARRMLRDELGLSPVRRWPSEEAILGQRQRCAGQAPRTAESRAHAAPARRPRVRRRTRFVGRGDELRSSPRGAGRRGVVLSRRRRAAKRGCWIRPSHTWRRRAGWW